MHMTARRPAPIPVARPRRPLTPGQVTTVVLAVGVVAVWAAILDHALAPWIAALATAYAVAWIIVLLCRWGSNPAGSALARVPAAWTIGLAAVAVGGSYALACVGAALR